MGVFDVERFWETVESARADSKTGQFGFQDEWQSSVSNLSDTELAEAAHIVLSHVERISTRASFAAYLVHSRQGEPHGFARFCEWVIAHGRDDYEAFSEDPQALVGKPHPRCRWQETNLYQSVLMFIGIRARFRPTVAIASFQEDSLKNPAAVLARASACAVCPDLSDRLGKMTSIPDIERLLREGTGLDVEKAAAELPNLARGSFLESLGTPIIDRRTPMSIHKFWEVLARCKSMGGRPEDLRAILGVLPSSQVAQFHELLRACLVSAVASSLGTHMPDQVNAERFLFALALEGQQAYRDAVKTGTAPLLKPVDAEFLDIALEVFRAQTTMDLPPLVTHDRAA